MHFSLLSTVDNEIDGQVFYDLEYMDIVVTISSLKARKAFIKVFEKVTGLVSNKQKMTAPKYLLLDYAVLDY